MRQDSNLCWSITHRINSPDYSATIATHQFLVTPTRFELVTVCLEGRCSIQLSYGTIFFVSRPGFEPGQLFSRHPLKMVCLPFHHLDIFVLLVGLEPTMFTSWVLDFKSNAFQPFRHRSISQYFKELKTKNPTFFRKSGLPFYLSFHLTFSESKIGNSRPIGSNT